MYGGDASIKEGKTRDGVTIRVGDRVLGNGGYSGQVLEFFDASASLALVRVFVGDKCRGESWQETGYLTLENKRAKCK